MWSIVGMGSFKYMLKGRDNTTPLSTFILGPIDSDRQFPSFKSNPSTPHRHYSEMEQTNLSPLLDESATKNNTVGDQLCNKKKKKRRKRRKKRNKTQNAPPLCVSIEVVGENCDRRQRQLSTSSEDSFVICFEENYQNSDVSEDFDSIDSAVARKKVRFADDDELCQVHPMITWAYAYQAARKGPWEECARDRDRFSNRVNKIEAEISHVFAPEHRVKIFNERFM